MPAQVECRVCAPPGRKPFRLSCDDRLVSANYDMATSYIVGRVENGDYGLAIAYCSVLIAFMVAVVLLIQLVVGRRRLGRRAPTAVSLEGQPTSSL